MKTAYNYSLVVLLMLCCITTTTVQAKDDALLGHEIRLAEAVGVDKKELNRALAAAERHQVRKEIQMRWISQMRSTAEEGLLTGPLLSKIEEGVTKNIDAERIDAVLGQVIQHLRFANTLMAKDPEKQPAPTPAERQRILVRMSNLLSAGVTQAEMNRLYETWKLAPQKQKLEATTFYAVAKQAGLTPDEAARIAFAGIAHNHFQGFPLDLAMMIKAAKANCIPNL